MSKPHTSFQQIHRTVLRHGRISCEGDRFVATCRLISFLGCTFRLGGVAWPERLSAGSGGDPRPASWKGCRGSEWACHTTSAFHSGEGGNGCSQRTRSLPGMDPLRVESRLSGQCCYIIGEKLRARG